MDLVARNLGMMSIEEFIDLGVNMGCDWFYQSMFNNVIQRKELDKLLGEDWYGYSSFDFLNYIANVESDSKIFIINEDTKLVCFVFTLESIKKYPFDLFKFMRRNGAKLALTNNFENGEFDETFCFVNLVVMQDRQIAARNLVEDFNQVTVLTRICFENN